MSNDRIRLVEDTILKHEGELKSLDIRVTNLENVSLKLENTILREGQETRRILEQVIKHTQRMEKAKLDVWVTVIGTGGIAYIIIETILKAISK
ncbi:MAG TPA: hypothetical protein VK190_11365 [Pseudoneobacillus sp.]|jgi:hypothetical protein|nr:hypothetical protein [Pseudoneobacillus sp.]